MMALGPIFRSVENRQKSNIYHILYTNGVLIDEAMLEKIKFLKIRERSEERRVGKECRSRGSREREKKLKKEI